jgi:hypothetical protein
MRVSVYQPPLIFLVGFGAIGRGGLKYEICG